LIERWTPKREIERRKMFIWLMLVFCVFAAAIVVYFIREAH